MFTGIVQGRATVTACDRDNDITRLTLEFPDGALADVQTGASIALNGVCLTVTAAGPDWARFDVMQVTLDITSLGDAAVGDLLNFERAMRASDEIGGHLLSGHVSATGSVVAVESTGHGRLIEIQAPPELMPYLFDKGYVGVDGASLTIVRVAEQSFSVSLIPETLRLTTLEFARPGTRVNLEIDSQTRAVVDTVERLLARRMQPGGQTPAN